MAGIKHLFVNPKADGADTTITRPSNWNADHDLPVTTKGDLMVATGVDAIDRLGVGANGQVVIADSAATLGVKWGAVPAHGASEHTDITRHFFLPAQVFTLAAGSPALAAQGTNTRYSAWAFDATADEYIAGQFYLPIDTTGNATLVVKIVWTNLGAGSGNVVWEFFDAAVADTGDLNSTAGEGANTETLAAPSQNILKTSAISAPGLPAQSTNLVRFRFGRRGSSASDTLGNDAGLLGLLVEYTASQ